MDSWYFSRAKLTLDDHRKRVLPMHFEQQVRQFANKRLWNALLIKLLLKLDENIFFPLKIPIHKYFSSKINLNIFLQPWLYQKYVFIRKLNSRRY